MCAVATTSPTAPGFDGVWNVEDALDYIRVPVLAIQGRQDEYGTLAHIEALEARVGAPVERTIIDDCRHAPHLEQPEATLAAVAEFLATLFRLEDVGAAPS